MAPDRDQRLERLPEAAQRGLDPTLRGGRDLLADEAHVRLPHAHHRLVPGLGQGAGVRAAGGSRGRARARRGAGRGDGTSGHVGQARAAETADAVLVDAHRLPVGDAGPGRVPHELPLQAPDEGHHLLVLPRRPAHPAQRLARRQDGQPVAIAQVLLDEPDEGPAHELGLDRRDVDVIEEDDDGASFGRGAQPVGADPGLVLGHGRARTHDHRLEAHHLAIPPVLLDDEVVGGEAGHGLAVLVEDDHVEADDVQLDTEDWWRRLLAVGRCGPEDEEDGGQREEGNDAPDHTHSMRRERRTVQWPLLVILSLEPALPAAWAKDHGIGVVAAPGRARGPRSGASSSAL